MSIYMMPVSIRKKLESLCNNFFIGGDLDDKKMTWVKWNRCLASKKEGGLGIGSIFGINIGTSIVKLDMKFFKYNNGPLPSCHSMYYGHDGGISAAPNISHKRSTWGSIRLSIQSLKQKVAFRCRSAVSKFASVRSIVDRSGIEVGSTLCPCCLDYTKSINHSFFSCGIAKDPWALLARWWELDISVLSIIGRVYEWIGSFACNSPSRFGSKVRGVVGIIVRISMVVGASVEATDGGEGGGVYNCDRCKFVLLG
ncbi:hypothetical protein Tco_0666579 [Tanacetum coccineum]